MLEVKSVSKSYKVGAKIYEILKDINFSISKGEFAAVMGPSGSGKTTLLNCISSFLPCDSGEIILDNKDITRMTEKEIAELCNKKLGFVFQDFMVLDGLTVFENICIPNLIAKTSLDKMENKARQLLEFFNIKEISDKYPAEISGGQKQRTAVARALMNDPLLVLADEPTGNLDSNSSKAVIQAFTQAKTNLGATIFMVTHDTFSASYCDRVIILKDGKIVKHLTNHKDRRDFHDTLLDVLKKFDGGECI